MIETVTIEKSTYDKMVETIRLSKEKKDAREAALIAEVKAMKEGAAILITIDMLSGGMKHSTIITKDAACKAYETVIKELKREKFDLQFQEKDLFDRNLWERIINKKVVK
jgi:hypothetical protein